MLFLDQLKFYNAELLIQNDSECSMNNEQHAKTFGEFEIIWLELINGNVIQNQSEKIVKDFCIRETK